MRATDSKKTAAKSKSKRGSPVVPPAKKMKAKKTTALALREKAKTEKVQQIDAELKRIAGSINDREKLIRGTVKALTQEVAESGRELLEAQRLHTAKGQKGKGFKRWIEENCPFSVVTGYNYIRLFQVTLRKPKLLLGRLQDAYVESGVKKALSHRPSHLKNARPAEHDGPIIEANAVPVSDGDYVSVPVPEVDGWLVSAQVHKNKVEHCREHISELLMAMKQALSDFFKARAS